MKITGSQRIALAIAAVVAVASQSCAAKALELEPSSRWELDYADDSCALRRMFGEGDQRAQIELRKFQPGDAPQVIIASNISKTRKTSFRYRFEPATDWKTDDGRLFLTFGKDFSGALFRTGLIEWNDELSAAYDEMAPVEFTNKAIADELEAAGQVTGFSIEKVFNRSLFLHTGPLDAPLRAMNKCLDELVTHWGIDVDAHRTLTRHATPTNLKKVPRMMDYPPKMLAKGMPGYVNVRLDINESGGISACHIQMPLSDPEFERSTCADLQHALIFDPALDKDGKPIRSYWITQVRFQIN